MNCQRIVTRTPIAVSVVSGEKSRRVSTTWATSQVEFGDTTRYPAITDCINIDDVVGDIDVFPLVGCFRDFGVEHFTFSSTWSSAVKTAWLFKMNGCEVEGLVEVNGNTNYMTGKHVKMPAYKFAVKWGREQ